MVRREKIFPSRGAKGIVRLGHGRVTFAIHKGDFLGVLRLTDAGAASTLEAGIDGGKPGGLDVTIQLKPEQEQRIAEALRSGAYQSAEDVIDRALEVLYERDKWLVANRQAVDAKIRRGIEELNRGKGIPEDELDARLKALKAQAE